MLSRRGARTTSWRGTMMAGAASCTCPASLLVAWGMTWCRCMCRCVCSMSGDIESHRNVRAGGHSTRPAGIRNTCILCGYRTKTWCAVCMATLCSPSAAILNRRRQLVTCHDMFHRKLREGGTLAPRDVSAVRARLKAQRSLKQQLQTRALLAAHITAVAAPGDGDDATGM